MTYRRLSSAVALTVIPVALAAAAHARADEPRPRAEVADVTGPNMPQVQQATKTTKPAAHAAASTERMSPKRVAAAVETELEHDALTSLRAVDVAVKNGTAILTGSVDTLLARERAERIARTVKGVYVVTNDITVSPRHKVAPDELHSNIRQALLNNAATESRQLDVTAQSDGEVHLRGTVQSWAERQIAEQAAKNVSGVTVVRNHIAVDYAHEREDAQIAADVKGLLRWDAYLDDRQIDVAVGDSVVKLSGIVGSAAERDRAINVAWLAGVKDVDAAGLKVDADRADGMQKRAPAETMSDADIAAAARNRLAWTPYVSADDVKVEVDEGVATLRGAVSTLKAQRIAASVVSQIRGVASVRDRLRIASSNSPDDKQLQTTVASALAANPITDLYRIDVSVTGGSVELTGNVDSWFEKGTADDVVAGVRGVREIDNRLQVRNTYDWLSFDPYVDSWSVYAYDWYRPQRATVWKLDSTIREQIEDELWWSPFVDANDVHVTVQNGVATLTGTVNSSAELRAAQENAFEGGAAGVINRLRVES